MAARHGHRRLTVSAPVLVLVTLTSRDPGDPAHEVRERHLRALRSAGLTPVCVAAPEVEAVLGVCAAAYLPGTDYVPETLDEDDGEAGAHRAGMRWDPAKVEADLAVLRLAWERRLPVLGVCGGMQAMAILGGGTLRMASGDAHRSARGEHAVRLVPGSLAANAFGGVGEVAANSFHRQVVERVPDGLRDSGRAVADGAIEALEADRAEHPFWLGVQWHPELLADPRPFAALARAAADAGAT